MTTFESLEVPFVQIGNRRGLTMMQLADFPELAEFVKRFPDSFEYHGQWDVVLFIEPEPVAPAPNAMGGGK